MKDGKSFRVPTVQTLEGSKISELKWLLYGPPGIGKSTFFSKATDGKRVPWFLHTDPGLRFIKGLKTPIMSWKEFIRVTDKVVADPPRHVSMIVLDTADLLFRMCRKYICDKRNIEHVSDEQWGKGYDLVRDEFEQTITKLAKLDTYGIGLAFISQSKDIEVRGRSLRTSKIVPTLPKQGLDIIAPLCDVIGYAGFSMAKADGATKGDMGRIAIFEPDETVEAKDRTGMLPKKCKLDFDLVRMALEKGSNDEDDEDDDDEEEEIED